MMDVRPRVNLYIFLPHPRWEGVGGAFAVAARDFQRAEKLALRKAEEQGIPAYRFSILEEPASDPVGHWTEVARYRNVDDEERLVLFSFATARASESTAAHSEDSVSELGVRA